MEGRQLRGCRASSVSQCVVSSLIEVSGSEWLAAERENWTRCCACSGRHEEDGKVESGPLQCVRLRHNGWWGYDGKVPRQKFFTMANVASTTRLRVWLQHILEGSEGLQHSVK
jgi:hypothetical protein